MAAHFDQKTLIRLSLIAFPMGIQTMLASLATNIPRYVIDHDLGTAMLGKFAAMAYFLVAGRHCDCSRRQFSTGSLVAVLALVAASIQEASL